MCDGGAMEKSSERFCSLIHKHTFTCDCCGGSGAVTWLSWRPCWFCPLCACFPLSRCPVSIASDRPYTMTLMPRSHQRQFLLVLTWVGELHIAMRSLEKVMRSGLFFWGRRCVLAPHEARWTHCRRFMRFKGQRSLTQTPAWIISVATEVLVRGKASLRSFFFSQFVLRWSFIQCKYFQNEFQSFYWVAPFVFSTSGSLLTWPFKHVTDRRRSSWTGGVNSTPPPERKTSTGRTWREASTRWR